MQTVEHPHTLTIAISCVMFSWSDPVFAGLGTHPVDKARHTGS